MPLEEEVAAIDIEQLIRVQVRQAILRMVQDIVTDAVDKLGRRVLEEARWSDAMGEIVRAAIDDAARNVLNPKTRKE